MITAWLMQPPSIGGFLPVASSSASTKSKLRSWSSTALVMEPTDAGGNQSPERKVDEMARKIRARAWSTECRRKNAG
jgi:hypothetical protein